MVFVRRPSSQLFNHWGSVNRLTWKFGPIHRPAASRIGNCSLMVMFRYCFFRSILESKLSASHCFLGIKEELWWNACFDQRYPAGSEDWMHWRTLFENSLKNLTILLFSIKLTFAHICYRCWMDREMTFWPLGIAFNTYFNARIAGGTNLGTYV